VAATEPLHSQLTHAEAVSSVERGGESGEAPLPAGWSQATDSAGCIYFYCAATQATQWDRPTCATDGGKGCNGQTSLPKGWHETRATDGRKYYYNAESGVTQWKKPEPEAEAAKGEASAPAPESELDVTSSVDVTMEEAVANDEDNETNAAGAVVSGTEGNSTNDE